MSSADRARSRMVNALVASGRVRSRAVEEALRAVPRHLFLPLVSVRAAYADEAVAVQHVDGAATSSASQPSMVAIMLEQLDLMPGQRVLEIGAGTGWNAALMARLVGPTGTITSVDIDAGLVASARGHLVAAGAAGVELRCGDGALGHPPRAPYDRIVLTVGSVDIRPEWVAQLAPRGRLLLPLTLRGSQLSVALDLGPDGLLRSRSAYGCGFIRLRGAAAGGVPPLAVGDGFVIQPQHDAPVPLDPRAVAALLEAPGAAAPAGVPVGPRDVWDGFGLWLALNDPTTIRILDGPAGFPTGEGRRTVALLGPGPGMAVLTVGAPEPGSRPARAGDPAASPVPASRGPVPSRPVPSGAAPSGAAPSGATQSGAAQSGAVRAYGPAGAPAAARMRAALAAWDDAGRPDAADLRLLVALRPHPLPEAANGVVVPLPSAVVRADWADGPELSPPP